VRTDVEKKCGKRKAGPPAAPTIAGRLGLTRARSTGANGTRQRGTLACGSLAGLKIAGTKRHGEKQIPHTARKMRERVRDDILCDDSPRIKRT
jgi:hypothetical protein